MMKRLTTLLAFLLALSPAQADFSISQLHGFNVQRPAPAIEFETCAPATNDATTYTASSVSTDVTDVTKRPRRTVIIVAMGEDGATNFSVSGATLDGVAMNEIVDSVSVTTGSLVAGAIYVGTPPPDDVTADIAVTFSEAITGVLICVFIATDLRYSVTGTAVASLADFETSSAASTLDINIRSTGIAVGGSISAGTTDTTTWTGLDEQADACSAEFCGTGAMTNTPATADEIPRAISADATNTNDMIGVTASFF